MHSLFWELHQQREISRAGSDASNAKSTAEQMRADVYDLTRKMERMSLACQAMWELLRDTASLQETDILDKMQEIDLRDGVADRKIGHNAVKCPSCGRPANTRRSQCIYCAAEIPREHVFE